jgi:hypothetical protein
LRSKADQLEYERQKKVASDFSWCVENDFQVYVRPDSYDMSGKGQAPFRIYIRRKGITTEGKDSIITPEGIEIKSKVTDGKIEYKTMSEACNAMDQVYANLRKRYG